ncbi:PRC-barrel domain-containing protein [Algoriphagus litoralis]|uniref:PRC-barrel domain-containing protein n=1 Tax=Algoriphagus litoralis TaxID=2202829 RepID=UPI000DB97097|nr:PRC-barrel domain-containing protein [Algoriphagus litoralis]
MNTISSQISCSTVFSSTVRTSRDESVGKIKEFMINTQTGQIDYVVLKVDEGFLNLGSKLLALPFESFEFSTAENDLVIVKETKETLENAPGFDSENWPTGPQPEFLPRMRSYFSEEPRSLYGRYNNQNKSFYNKDEVFDSTNDKNKEYISNARSGITGDMEEGNDSQNSESRIW